MESVISDGMCRCCATEGNFKDFQVSFLWMGVEEIYGNMLKECFDITLLVSEEVNNGGICEVCITQLRNAYNFKRQVQATEDKFRKMIDERAFKTDEIKMEVTRFDDEDSNNSADDFSSQEYEVPIKEEKVEEKPRKRAARASTSKAKKSKTAVGETSTKRKLRKPRTSIIKIGEKQLVKSIHLRKEKSIDIFINKDELIKKRKEKNQHQNNIKEILLNTNATLIRCGLFEKREKADQHQNNIKEILLNTNATPIRCRGGIGYTCCFCNDQYPDPADLKTHTIQNHTDADKANFMKGTGKGRNVKNMYDYVVKLDITDLKCNLCELNLDNIESITDHLKNVHNKNMFTDLKNHILPFKFGKETLSCFMCYNIFNSFKALQEHMNVHYRNYICTVCDAGFVNKNNLLRHGDAHKTGDFKCLECSKTFDTARKKKLHDRAKHSGELLPHKCGYCFERFKEVWKKYEHLSKIHGVKTPSINCQACDKSFETKHAWRLHTTRVHLMQRNYKCLECEMEFYTKKELESHVVRHTGSREFRCEVCFKSYGRQKTLRDHVRRVHS